MSSSSSSSSSAGGSASCGNGVTEPTEQCDDADQGSGDGCSSSCQTEDGYWCHGQPSICEPAISWSPPIGVPIPEFGIYETVENTYGSASFFTHYVDNTHPNSTDTNNPNGTLIKPRRTIPGTLNPGSVVEVHGGPYTSAQYINVSGTEAQPIFIRGASVTQRPLFTGGRFEIGNAHHVIVENVRIDSQFTSGVRIVNGSSYISFRNNEVMHGQGNVILANASNVVVYHNTLHDSGDDAQHPWDFFDPNNPDYDPDQMGVFVSTPTHDIWVVDNIVYHSSGNGIGIGGQDGESNASSQRVYVGRNELYANRQCGIGFKRGTDFIISQNRVYNQRAIRSEDGSAITFQYGPEYIWILYNEISSSDRGITIEGDSCDSDCGTYLYVVGNVISNIHGPSYEADDPFHGTAIRVRGMPNKYFVNNTIYDVDLGIHGIQDHQYVMENNIIAQVNPAGYHVYLLNEQPTTWTMNNNLFYQGGSAARIRVGSQTFNHQNHGHGAGNLLGNPLFVNQPGGDFHLTSTSPARNTGLLSVVYGHFSNRYQRSIAMNPSYTGNTPRPQGGAWDMGAFEFAPD